MNKAVCMLPSDLPGFQDPENERTAFVLPPETLCLLDCALDQQLEVTI